MRDSADAGAEMPAMRLIATLVDLSSAGRANLLAACRLAADQSATVLTVHPVEVPDIYPLDYPMDDTITAISPECERAKRIGDEFGVALVPAICQAYSAVDAVVGIAEREGVDAICLAAPRGILGWARWLRGPGPPIAAAAPCPVLMIGGGWRPWATQDTPDDLESQWPTTRPAEGLTRFLRAWTHALGS